MLGSAPIVGAAAELASSTVAWAVTGKRPRVYSSTGSVIFDVEGAGRTLINTVKALRGEKDMSERDWHNLARSVIQTGAATLGPAAGSANKGLSSLASLTLAAAGASNLAKPILDRAYPGEKKPARPPRRPSI